MAYDVFASPVPVSEERRATMIGLRFATEAQALERARTLHRSGWHVYRVTGPGGFEMAQDVIDEYCNGTAGSP
jgi:hypothetical protein